MKLALKGKIVLLLLIALTILLSSGFLSYFSTSGFIDNANLVAHTYQVLAELQATDANVKDAEISQRNYLLTNLESYLQPYNQARANEMANITNLRQLTSDNPVQQTRLNHLETLLNAHLKFIDEVIRLKDQQGSSAASQLLRTGQGQQILDQIRQVIDEMKSEENNLLQVRAKDSAASSQQTILLFWVLIVVVAALFVLIYYLLNRDISQRRQSELTLSERENQLRLITDNIPAQISYIDSNRDFKFVNKRVEEWFGLPANQIVDKPVKETLGEKLYATMEDYISRALAGEEIVYEHYRPSLTGEDHIFEVAYLPHKSEDKRQVLGFYSFVEDITERKRAEEQIQSLNRENEKRIKELTVLNQELEAFSYSVSHDLRAPLRSIDGFSQALLDDYAEKLDDDGQNYLQRVRKASQRMAELIDDLLSLSRLTRMEMKNERIELSRLVEEIAAELQNSQPERQATFKIQPELTTLGDQALLRAALQNLLGNAWKFSRKRAHTCIEFGVIREKEPPTYFIRDNGAGFDMAYAGRLFGAFQRLHAMTEFEGTGIGLAIVQRVVHRHGGQVWAESAVDQGATFYFTL